MNLTISIPDDVVAALRRRAAAGGQTVPAYTSKLVEQAVKLSTLEELLAPVHADFAKSGLTEAQLLELDRDLVQKVRAEKKG